MAGLNEASAVDLSGVSAALFDLDGTLVDSEPVHRQVWAAFFAARGWHVSEEEYVANFVGRRGADVFRTIDGPWRGEDPDRLLDEAIGYLPTVDAKPEPMPGAAALVRSLHRSGIPAAVVTSALRPWVDEALELVGVADYIAATVTAEDVTVGKPDPEGFLLGCAKLGVSPGGAVAFEDSPSGVAAASAAAIATVVGVSTTSPPHVLRRAGAHHVVPTLEAAELRRTIQRRAKDD